MQTFLPYKSFKKSAQCLDYRRLGKQRVEAWQILTTLIEKKKAWSNHPAVLMWKNHEYSLTVYGLYICEEWISRGYKDTMRDRFHKLLESLYFRNYNRKHPLWLGSHEFHRSHKSNLLRKLPEHYKKFKWKISNDLEYVWPCKKEKS